MRKLLIILMCFAVFGCWEQSEVMSIDKQGHVRWLVIVKPGWSYAGVKDVQKLTTEYMDHMDNNGWVVTKQKKITDGDDVIIALEGDLNKVSMETEYYRISSRSQHGAVIQFLCPIYEEERVWREIKFKGGSNSARITDNKSQSVKYARCDNKRYMIAF